jgi:hypothetical protein
VNQRPGSEVLAQRVVDLLARNAFGDDHVGLRSPVLPYWLYGGKGGKHMFVKWLYPWAWHCQRG